MKVGEIWQSRGYGSAVQIIGFISQPVKGGFEEYIRARRVIDKEFSKFPFIIRTQDFKEWYTK
jgi:hypothetical protein